MTIRRNQIKLNKLTKIISRTNSSKFTSMVTRKIKMPEDKNLSKNDSLNLDDFQLGR